MESMVNIFRIIAYKGPDIAVIDAKDEKERDEKLAQLNKERWTIDGIFPL